MILRDRFIAFFERPRWLFERGLNSLERPAVHIRLNHTITLCIEHGQPAAVVKVAHQTPLQLALGETPKTEDVKSTLPDVSSYSALLDALNVMQSHYYRIWPGTWPSAIDWTAAVIGTQVSATLAAITDSMKHTSTTTAIGKPVHYEETEKRENTINQYFTQITSFYHGENAFSLRTQAYDDMLWVVLGWLESIKFIHRHSQLYYPTSTQGQQTTTKGVNTTAWYAQQFIPQFAHRARVFHDLASKGWDTSLCGGGMIWTPYLAPYKNAITNQLFIAASVSMYLYFPGDDNPSPFAENGPSKAHSAHYLTAAIKAYDWLKASNMTNHLGLYTDGFHISSLRYPNSTRTGRCDLRDEKVYTYNQGVILSGLRGLYTATSNSTYLEDGHQLIRDVKAASGWEDHDSKDPWVRYRWAGLGRGGVMEEACDASGSCSQNGQTFKGIWWHHFTVFCQPIEMESGEGPEGNGAEAGNGASNQKETALLHRRSCESYSEWMRWNAKAAWETRNREGRFGEWWGDHRWRRPDELGPVNDQGTDYRNEGVPDDKIWRETEVEGARAGYHDFTGYARPLVGSHLPGRGYEERNNNEGGAIWDPNDRGRGRTVETQSGGLAVVRALYRWETWYPELDD